ncbi:fucose permease [Actinoplanes xinjiangensis]|uniref:Fucose permease n=1 Tax=Actinoplanes xinjiangensis TaxID=512350 RepID=A0A316F3K4_9ACTN|nr:MFS transporter [Actinoplanes xinjiangensis]PWK31051.1 fucose permease [Actinoplanes xinjiangensis]GIF44179.1 MFS transporter [Actinoplanes xinjiangensis]
MRATRAISLVFAGSGATQASWMSRLPAVLDQTHTDVVRLSAGLVMLGIGTLTAMALTGPAVARLGSRPVVVAGFALTMLSLIAIAVAHSPATLTAAMLGMGVGGGVWDAGMNMQASALERDHSAHLMSRCHGWWSIGSMAAAGVGAAAAALSIGLLPHLIAVLLVTAVLFGRGVTTFGGSAGTGPGASGTGRRSPVRRLAAIGTLLFCGAVVEGAAGDWLAVYLHQDRELTHAGAALWYTLFVTAMAAGRLIADRPHRRFGAAGLVRTGAVVTALSIVLVIAGPTGSWLHLAALGWGVGICWVFPAALSATGNVAPPSAVATMTAIGYSASVAGPLVIGRLAHSAGLEAAISAMLPLVLAVALFAPALTGADPDPPT